MPCQIKSSHYSAPHPSQPTKIVTPSKVSVAAEQGHTLHLGMLE